MPQTVVEAGPRSEPESGTPPGDRRFRPDVEGLRAIAILVVVLFHAGVPHLDGGYVGVDVFFVISGFVITGLLLRERAGTGKNSLLHFYARRCRRILPAATLVIIIVVVATYLGVNVLVGNATADDGRWAAVFLVNFHFAAEGTNYFNSTVPPSALQNFWSLSVEEQFYLVFPALFLLAAKLKGVLSLRVRLTALLGVVLVLSYGLSVVQTGSQPVNAYFSPFTRAWELALGALIALGTPWLQRLPSPVARACSWVGLAAIVGAAVTFTADTIYPGSLVALPVLGAGLVIAGGAAGPGGGAESLLGRRPLQWLGRRSYSWYLWHWPILIIAADSRNLETLPLWENLVLVLVALGMAWASYAFIENPIRLWSLSPARSVLGGVTLIVATVLALTLVIDGNAQALTYRGGAAPDDASVTASVAQALTVHSLPADLRPPLALAPADWGGNSEPQRCIPGITQVAVPTCVLGDRHGKRLMVLYGDSHALMWLPAFAAVAASAHWRLVVLAKPGCPAASVTVVNPPYLGPAGGPYRACSQWHRWAISWINRNDPGLLVLTEVDGQREPGRNGSPPHGFTESQWEQGVVRTLHEVTAPGTTKEILGATPSFPQSPVTCLKQYPTTIQRCSIPTGAAILPSYSDGEQAAARSTGVRYVETLPWFCTSRCPAIVNRTVVYMDNNHTTATYARYLTLVLGQVLQLPAA